MEVLEKKQSAHLASKLFVVAVYSMDSSCGSTSAENQFNKSTVTAPLRSGLGIFEFGVTKFA